MGKFDDFLASAGLGFLDTASGVLAGGVQQKRQRNLMKYQYELNEQAANAAYARQKQFWDMNNRYNSFSNQKTLMQAAGLNPALMYSDGTSGALAGGVSAPEGSGASGGSAQQVRGTDFLQSALLAAQIRNINADTAQKQGNTYDPDETLRGQALSNNIRELEVVNKQLANDSAAFDLSFRQMNLDTDLAINKQKLENLRFQAEEMDARIATLLDQHLNNPLVRNELVSRALLNHAQIALAESHVDLNSVQAQKLLADISNLDKLNQLLDERIQTEPYNRRLLDAKSELEKIMLGDVRNIPQGARVFGATVKYLLPVFGLFDGK